MLKIYEIRCGKHRGKVRGSSVLDAWRRMTRGNTRGLPPLAKIRVADGPWFVIDPWLLNEGGLTREGRRAAKEEMG